MGRPPSHFAVKQFHHPSLVLEPARTLDSLGRVELRFESRHGFVGTGESGRIPRGKKYQRLRTAVFSRGIYRHLMPEPFMSSPRISP